MDGIVNRNTALTNESRIEQMQGAGMDGTSRGVAALTIAACFFVQFSLRAQLPATAIKEIAPEAAFISPLRYTNAFFGFSLPLPKEPALQVVKPSHKADSRHYLFAMRAEKFDETVFRVKPKVTV